MSATDCPDGILTLLLYYAEASIVNMRTHCPLLLVPPALGQLFTCASVTESLSGKRSAAPCAARQLPPLQLRPTHARDNACRKMDTAKKLSRLADAGHALGPGQLRGSSAARGSPRLASGLGFAASR